jgi:uroporphyrinogen decarboxylase
MVDTGSAVLELDYKCDLSKIKQATQGKTTILGVIDPSSVLAFGTPEQVTQKVCEELEILAPGGGLILGPGCALSPQTPHENIHTLIESAHRYGRYTSDGLLIKGR